MLKAKEYKNYDEFEQDNEHQKDNLVTIVNYQNRVCADAIITCKRAKTAVKKFMEALKNDSRFEGWGECLAESIENGVFKNAETNCNGEYTGGWFYEVQYIDDDSVYVCVTVAK